MIYRKKDGFTLIELLVVIAIIAILAAILFPVFVSALATARKSVCATNENQISKALKMYAQDYKGYYPPIDSPGGTGWDGGTALHPWLEIAIKYISDKNVVKCPGARPYNPYTKIWGFERYMYGYAINSNLSWDNPVSGYGLGAEAVIRNPSRTLLLADGHWTWFAYDTSEDWLGTTSDNPAWWSNKVAWRHPFSKHPRKANTGGGGGANFACADMHSVYLRQPDIDIAGDPRTKPAGYNMYP